MWSALGTTLDISVRYRKQTKSHVLIKSGEVFMLKTLRIFSALLLMLCVSLVLGTVMIGCDNQKTDDELHIEESVVSGLIYEVSLNGETLFSTESLEGYFAALAKVEKTMSETLGYPHSVENDLDIKLVAIETTAKVASSDDMYSIILSETKALYSDCYTIYLDGNVLGLLTPTESLFLRKFIIIIWSLYASSAIVSRL